MSSDPREPAREQAEEAYHGFINFTKYFAYIALAGVVFVSSCNFGVDGTGSKSDPSYYEDYKERMEEMKEEIKKRKYGET
tara:strand:+ start:6717 stop:6956 length:240 start_codon:yes stop_codon:yes gene_type:complete